MTCANDIFTRESEVLPRLDRINAIDGALDYAIAREAIDRIVPVDDGD